MSHVTISEAEYARLLALDAKKKANAEKWKAAGRKFIEENPDKMKDVHKESAKRYYEKLKANPVRYQQHLFKEALGAARRRLDRFGYVGAKVRPEIAHELNLIFDDANKRWVRPPTQL